MRRPIILLLLWLLLVNCYSQEKYIPQSTNFAEFAIYEAITDFADNCRLFKQDSVFNVHVEDTSRYVTLQRHQGILKWVCDSVYTNLLMVGISGERDKMGYYSDAVIGSKGKLPSRYVIVKGKLFYWDDDDYPLTEETLSVLKKYDALTDMIHDRVLPETAISDSKEIAFYYFCRNNLLKHKRAVSSKSAGYYRPPKLKCGN